MQRGQHPGSRRSAIRRLPEALCSALIRSLCDDALVARAFVAAIVLAAAMAVFAQPRSLAGSYGGTVESADAETGQLAIQFITRKETREFRIDAETRITVDGEKAAFADVKPGQRVSVVTDRSGRVIRVTARSLSRNASKAADIDSSGPPGVADAGGAPRSRDRETAAREGNRAEWPGYRGPSRNNISPDTGLSNDWSTDPPRPLWMAEGLGDGFSTVSLARGMIFTMGTAGRREVVLALDADDGNRIWSRPTGGPVFQDGHGDGPRGTPTLDGDRVYALGASGDLLCLGIDDGNVLWRKNILRDFDAGNITWGISESVLIDGARLICTPGGRDAGLVALNKHTGDVLWKAAVPGDPRAAYASAVVADVDGVRQYINFLSSGVVGVRADDGRFLWEDRSTANGTANVSAPVFTEEGVFTASGYGTGGSLLKLTSNGDTTDAELAYHTNDMKNHHGGMVAIDGYLYGSNDPGVLTCLELKSGRVAWKDRSVGKGAVAYADGHLYVRSEAGPLALVEATPEDYREKGRIDQPYRSDMAAWSHPVIFGGRLYLRDMDKLLVYDVRAR